MHNIFILQNYCSCQVRQKKVLADCIPYRSDNSIPVQTTFEKEKILLQNLSI